MDIAELLEQIKEHISAAHLKIEAAMKKLEATKPTPLAWFDLQTSEQEARRLFYGVKNLQARLRR